jgi:hypothetical protein
VSVLAKSSLVVLTAMVVAGPNVAHAVVGPESTFQGFNPYPTHRGSICMGGNCRGGAYFYGATQHVDCNKAGLAQPRRLYTPADIPGFTRDELDNQFGPSSPGDGSDLDWPEITPSDNGLDLYDPKMDFRPEPHSENRPSATNGYEDYFESRIGLNFEVAGPRSHSRSESGGKVAVYSRAQIKLGNYFPGDDTGTAEFSGDGIGVKDIGADQDPIKGTTSNSSRTDEPNTIFNNFVEEMYKRQIGGLGKPIQSINVETPIGAVPEELGPYLYQQYNLGGTTHSSLMFPQEYLGDVLVDLNSAGISSFEPNGCWQVLVPTDPNFLRTGRNGGNSWGEKEDDQWAIKRVGFTDDETSAWNLLPEAAAPAVVAVIDTGLDWHHLDISADNVWRNVAEFPDNGVDDDNNGYVDDIIGWDFLAKNNRPWDFDGHGTVVTGIIAATQNNEAGIAGINPHVKIMVLKAVSNFGTTRPSFIAEAIVYAVDNGAKVINISVGGPHASRMVQAAIDYAHQEGVLVVAASGNDGVELDDFGPGGADNVLTVGATHVDDRAAAFSNYGDKVDLVAPGVDVLSLRARYTDANYRPDGVDHGEDEYVLGTNYVGDDKRYLHVSGTSFSTPIVAGIASLLLSKNPELTAAEIERILLQTATDVDLPGNDKYTGHGMVNAQAALSVDADFSITAEITSLEPVPQEAPQFIRVKGTIDASAFKRAWMQIGPGENPGGWRYVGQKRKYPIVDGTLGTIPINQFTGSELWQVVINVEHRNGVVKSAAFPIKIK